MDEILKPFRETWWPKRCPESVMNHRALNFLYWFETKISKPLIFQLMGRKILLISVMILKLKLRS